MTKENHGPYEFLGSMVVNWKMSCISPEGM